MKLYFLTYAKNVSSHLEEVYSSLKEQTNKNFHWIVINDGSNDNTLEVVRNIEKNDFKQRVIVVNQVFEKGYLKSICDTVDILHDNNINNPSDIIVAILDGTDMLCNENTVDLILREYNNNNNLDTLWTNQTWDVSGISKSSELPNNINPYQYPWVSSHLKTFKLSVFSKVNKDNFLNLQGKWFDHGYDQALYLPILYLSQERKFLNEICYLYKVNNKSTKEIDNELLSSQVTRLVRARGYLK